MAGHYQVTLAVCASALRVGGAHSPLRCSCLVEASAIHAAVLALAPTWVSARRPGELSAEAPVNPRTTAGATYIAVALVTRRADIAVVPSEGRGIVGALAAVADSGCADARIRGEGHRWQKRVASI